MIEIDIYEQIESRQKTGHNRTCINGTVTGCGKCIGYCQYEGHPGYLTEQLRKEHQCIEKECFYYVPKPSRKKPPQKDKSMLDSLLQSANQLTTQLEGLRVMSVQELGKNRWQFNYIAISNDYPIQELIFYLEQNFHGEVTFKKLNYSFDRCVQLIFSDSGGVQ